MQLPETFHGIPTSIIVPNTNDPQHVNRSQPAIDPLQPATWSQFSYNNSNDLPPELSLDTSGFDNEGFQQHRRDHTGSVSSISSHSS